MLFRRIPIKLQLNHSLITLLSVIFSLVAGSLLYFWEAGRDLIVPPFFSVGLFYMRVLFLLSVPLVGAALWQGTSLLTVSWRSKRLSPRLALHYGTTVTGAVFIGVAAGLLMSGYGSSIFLRTVEDVPEMQWLCILLPPLMLLCFLTGPAGIRAGKEAAPAQRAGRAFFLIVKNISAILLHFLPVGTALLLIPLLALTGLQVLWLCLKLMLTGAFCGVLYIGLLYGCHLRRCGRDCPRHFWGFFRQAVFQGISSCDSGRCAETAIRDLYRLGVSEESSRSVFDLGRVYGAAGTGMYCGLLCMTAARFAGSLPGWELVLTAFLFCVMTCAGKLDFPGGGLFRGLLLILLLGIPPEGAIPFVITERFFDSLRTGMNVFSAGAGTYLSDKLRWIR